MGTIGDNTRCELHTNEPDAEYRFLHQKKNSFNGYDSEGSFVNKRGVERRCNPQFIPYLYAANSVDCCLAEIRPVLREYVSVAEIKSIKRIKILSLSKSFALSSTGESLVSGVLDTTVVLYLEQLFSKPYEAEGDYLLTQYISEKIKNAGFDGISFYSSVYDGCGNKENSINYTILNYRKYEPISSKLYKITAIKIESTCDPTPYTKDPSGEENVDDYFEEFEEALTR